LRSDRIAEITAATGLNGSHRYGFVTFDKYFFKRICWHVRHSLKTVIATSGHISAQSEQPVHFSGPENTAMATPRLLSESLNATSFFGQAMVQSPHPLQRVSSIMICGIDDFPLLISYGSFVAD
jgi:hypothetical protein